MPSRRFFCARSLARDAFLVARESWRLRVSKATDGQHRRLQKRGPRQAASHESGSVNPHVPRRNSDRPPFQSGRRRSRRDPATKGRVNAQTAARPGKSGRVRRGLQNGEVWRGGVRTKRRTKRCERAPKRGDVEQVREVGKNK
ncbi:hypothetical protein TRVL_05636 [Trypanosoma vivax]|nr:hypothetical protein TRVL_05636 [Trypanosoma vivax]